MGTDRKLLSNPHLPKGRPRAGRISIPGRCYFITKSVAGRKSNPLIQDPRFSLQNKDECNVVIDTLRWMSENRRIRVHGYVLMPDHIHLQFSLRYVQPLSQVMSSFFTWTSRNINRSKERTGRFWRREYHDTRIKDDQSCWSHINYIRYNPVRTEYVDRPKDWPYMETIPDW